MFEKRTIQKHNMYVLNIYVIYWNIKLCKFVRKNNINDIDNDVKIIILTNNYDKLIYN